VEALPEKVCHHEMLLPVQAAEIRHQSWLLAYVPRPNNHTTQPAVAFELQLILRAINSAHSAFLAVTLSSQFFESYNVFSNQGVVQAGVLIKVWVHQLHSTAETASVSNPQHHDDDYMTICAAHPLIVVTAAAPGW
jgi:hypothetical protein